MNKIYSTVAALLLLFHFVNAFAEDTDITQNSSNSHHYHSVDHYQPLGVIGAHTHEKGRFMIGLSREVMMFDKNYNDDGSISLSDAHQKYMMVNKKMTMRMDMLDIMYGLTENTTIMTMIGRMDMNMTHSHQMGMMPAMDMYEQSIGVTDLKIGAITNVELDNYNDFLYNVGFSLPTGSVDKEAKDGSVMGYNMQTGSGTFDFTPSVTYKQNISDILTIGTQLNATIRTGKNSKGYRFGNVYEFNTWFSYNINQELATSLRLNARTWGNIKGENTRDYMNQDHMSMPENNVATNPNIQSGSRISMLIGFNVIPKIFPGVIQFEGGLPIYQYLEGPQLGQKYEWRVGYKITL